MTRQDMSQISRRSILAVSATMLLSACVSSRAPKLTGNTSDETGAALAMVNKLRSDRGLAPLSPNTNARQAATGQAVRMAKADKMSHLIGLGDSFLSRMKSHSVPLPAAENIASGQNEVERAVQAWIDSPKHLENMLGNYRGLGVAVARDMASGNRPYWAMVLSS
nr:CAP domain-containing protein [Agrobacterium sp.]